MNIEILNVEIREKWCKCQAEAKAKFDEAHRLKKQADEVLHAIDVCTREGLVVCERTSGNDG